ncbi:MAG: MerR family transcriptional regulator [Dehalococcoidia bacterium]
MTTQNGVPLEEVRRYSGLNSAALRFYVELGLLPRPHVQRKGRGTKVWYPQEVIGLLTVIRRLKQRGMKLKEIAQLIAQREILEGDAARAVGSAPVKANNELESITALGEEFARQFPDRVVVVAVYDSELHKGQQTMVPVRIVHLPKEASGP